MKSWSLKFGPFTAEYAASHYTGMVISDNPPKTGFLRIHYSQKFCQDIAITHRFEGLANTHLNGAICARITWQAIMPHYFNPAPIFQDGGKLWEFWGCENLDQPGEFNALGSVLTKVMTRIAQYWAHEAVGLSVAQMTRLAPGKLERIKAWLEEKE